MQYGDEYCGGVRTIVCAVLFLQVLASTGCVESLKGQVLDAETGQPIQGAVVLGVWTTVEGLPGLHHHELVAVDETETDNQGRYALETPMSLRVDEEAVVVYKFGYVAWSNLFTFPTSPLHENARVPPKISLEQFPPAGSHQRHVDFIDSARRAVMYGNERIPKFWSAVQPELNMP
jgi:hypothetical protein